MLQTACISGTGSFLPEKILSNADLERMVDTSDEWITTRTGIKQRRILDDGLASSDMGYLAAKQALETAGITPGDVDLILTATITPDYCFPATACRIQAKLGATKAAAMDIEAACSGFLYGVNMASQFVATDVYRNVLVIGSECLSKITDYTDRASCILFGDGAGAAVVSASPDPSRGILHFDMGADGSRGDLMMLPAGGSQVPTTIETVKERKHYMHIRGHEVFKVAVQKICDLLLKMADALKVTLDDIALVVPHQSNLRILKLVAQKIGLPMEKMYANIDRFGNTSAASIPIALDEAVRLGSVKPGDLVVLVAFGGGLTWACTGIRW